MTNYLVSINRTKAGGANIGKEMKNEKASVLAKLEMESSRPAVVTTVNDASEFTPFKVIEKAPAACE